MKKDFIPVPKNKGQSLLETVFALAIILLVVLALVQIVTGSIRSSDFSQKSSQATAYCQEAMEKVRSNRDKNTWSTFKTNCQLTGTARMTAFGLTSPTGFTLSFDSCNIVTMAANKEQATVVLSVHWVDSTGDHKSELISYFSNWQ